jgi:hypothetical protein
VSVVVPCGMQKLVLDGAGDVDGGEEYVETRYYDGLIGIDKQHHTVSFECTLCPCVHSVGKNCFTEICNFSCA